MAAGPYEVAGVFYDKIPLGFPAREGNAPKRRTIEELTHRNTFGAR